MTPLLRPERLRALAQATCIIARRTQYYLGSFASRTYFYQGQQRVFSNLLYLASALAVAGAGCLLAFRHSAIGRQPVMAMSFVLFAFAEALLLIPEQRFAVLFHVVVCTLALCGLAGFCWHAAAKPLPPHANTAED